MRSTDCDVSHLCYWTFLSFSVTWKYILKTRGKVPTDSLFAWIYLQKCPYESIDSVTALHKARTVWAWIKDTMTWCFPVGCCLVHSHFVSTLTPLWKELHGSAFLHLYLINWSGCCSCFNQYFCINGGSHEKCRRCCWLWQTHREVFCCPQLIVLGLQQRTLVEFCFTCCRMQKTASWKLAGEHSENRSTHTAKNVSG